MNAYKLEEIQGDIAEYQATVEEIHQALRNAESAEKACDVEANLREALEISGELQKELTELLKEFK